MTLWACVRYFHAASPVRISFRIGLAAVVLLAVVFAVEGSGSDAALVSLTVVQMFAVSTGFRSHASRGHYDPPLTRARRSRLGLAHWIAATLPGAAAWAAIAIIQMVSLRSLRVPALAPSALTAFFLVSFGAWSVSAALGPLSGGSLWMTVSVAVIVHGGAMKQVGLLSTGDPVSPGLRFATALALPLFLVGAPLRGWELGALAGAGASAFGIACVYVSRLSVPLREDAS